MLCASSPFIIPSPSPPDNIPVMLSTRGEGGAGSQAPRLPGRPGEPSRASAAPASARGTYPSGAPVPPLPSWERGLGGEGADHRPCNRLRTNGRCATVNRADLRLFHCLARKEAMALPASLLQYVEQH